MKGCPGPEVQDVEVLNPITLRSLALQRFATVR
jgi:hypothetical protein